MIYLIITIGAITILTTVVALTYAALSTCNSLHQLRKEGKALNLDVNLGAIEGFEVTTEAGEFVEIATVTGVREFFVDYEKWGDRATPLV